VAGTHLDLEPAPRLRHVGELESALARHVPAGVPAIVAADVNDHPGSAPWSALAQRRTDAFAAAGLTGSAAFTSTAVEPHQTIDGVFVDPGLTVGAVRILDQPDVALASDHRPILVELELP
jgi:endonuclease/exonuclease/phosphatase family metal-dependent hydrolase